MKIKGSQKGSSLLIVMMMISVIGIITAASMRAALTAREQANISLADQVNETDNSIAMFNLTSYQPNAGINAYIHTLADTYPNTEIVYCYGDTSVFSMMQWPSTSDTPINSALGTGGYCSTSKLNNRLKGERKVSLTQVSVRRDKTVLPSMVSNDKVLTGRVFVATVTTLMPGLSNASYSSIDACLNSRVNNMSMVTHSLGTVDTRKPVVECLTDLGVPAIATTQTYIN